MASKLGVPEKTYPDRKALAFPVECEKCILRKDKKLCEKANCPVRPDPKEAR